MEEFKKWTDLSPEETRKIINFRPPGYYRWFYKFYKKYLATTICCLILAVGILGIIYNNIEQDFWSVLMIGFGLIGALGFWALTSYLIKHFYTKRFAKKMGLTMENWNYLTQGLSSWY